ncbi:hypothetical protein Ddc_15944 [Ditylenchus destructor]|nr:hypothetical protein Ddc_15944 [Ditylenchus destructor]
MGNAHKVTETSYNSGTDQHLLYEEYRNGSLTALKSLIQHELDDDMSVSHVFRRNKLEHLVEISSDIHLKQLQHDLQHVFTPELDNLMVYACRANDYAGIPPCYEII